MKQKVDNYEYPILNDTTDILKSIGMPDLLCNPRCAMTLAACGEMIDPSKWNNVSENYHGTHEIIAFINANFPNKAGLDKQGYQENSRETFRDETLKPWVNAGIMESRDGLASNSKNNAYRLTSQFAALLRKYNTDEWNEALAVYKSTHPDYAELLKQVKNLDPGYPVNYNGLEFTLGRSPHNKLQKAILDEFVPFFAPGAELLYIGDTSNRSLARKDDRLAELGINVFSESARLPDIVLYDQANKRILFIEAYYSGGEFTFDRVNEIKSYCHCEPGTEAVFITAFATRKKAISTMSTIAWDTDIWVVEDSTHMIHKNSNRFMGHKLD
jgi:hypothetical protein